MHTNGIKKSVCEALFSYVLLLQLFVCACSCQAISHQEFVATYKDNPPSFREYWKSKVDKKLRKEEEKLKDYAEKDSFLQSCYYNGPVPASDLQKYSSCMLLYDGSDIGDKFKPVINQFLSWGYTLDSIPCVYFVEGGDSEGFTACQLNYVREEINSSQKNYLYHDAILVGPPFFNYSTKQQTAIMGHEIGHNNNMHHFWRFYFRKSNARKDMQNYCVAQEEQADVHACLHADVELCESLRFQGLSGYLPEELKLLLRSDALFKDPQKELAALYQYTKEVERSFELRPDKYICRDKEGLITHPHPYQRNQYLKKLIYDMTMESKGTHIFNPEYKNNGLPRWVRKSFDEQQLVRLLELVQCDNDFA